MIDPANMRDLYLAVQVLDGLSAPWCICGGWAIDLYLNELTRPHKDLDIAIRRTDQLLFQSHLTLQGWQLEIAENGLWPWGAGTYHDPPADTVWCRKEDRFLELLFNDWDDSLFRFKRDRSIAMPSDRSTIIAASGYRILAPQIVLLYKSSSADIPDYRHDFEQAYPRLSPTARAWFTEALGRLYPDHPWLNTH